MSLPPGMSSGAQTFRHGQQQPPRQQSSPQHQQAPVLHGTGPNDRGAASRSSGSQTQKNPEPRPSALPPQQRHPLPQDSPSRPKNGGAPHPALTKAFSDQMHQRYSNHTVSAAMATANAAHTASSMPPTSTSTASSSAALAHALMSAASAPASSWKFDQPSPSHPLASSVAKRPSFSAAQLGIPRNSATSNSADPYNLARGAARQLCPPALSGRGTESTGNYGTSQSPTSLSQDKGPASSERAPQNHHLRVAHAARLMHRSISDGDRPMVVVSRSNTPLHSPSPKPPVTMARLDRQLRPSPAEPRAALPELLPRLAPTSDVPMLDPVGDTVMVRTDSDTSVASRKRKDNTPDVAAVKKQKKQRTEGDAKAKAKKLAAARYNLSNDIWLRILEYCPPLFLNKARLISKNFKHMVDNLDSIWVNNRKENFGHDMPDAPPGVSERQYLNLLGGKGCMEKGCDDRLATRTHWSWLERWCHGCWELKLEREDRIIKGRQSHTYSRVVIEKMLECLPVGMHDSFKKPHDYIAQATDNPPRNTPRLYRYHLTRDVDKIMREYDALTPAPFEENPEHTDQEKAVARQIWQEQMASLEQRRTAFFAEKKAANDIHMERVRQIEACIRNRRNKNRKPNDANRAARYDLFTRRAREDLPHIPEDFVVASKCFKAATRIFRDGGSERGWIALKPKIVKEYQSWLANKDMQAEEEEVSPEPEEQLDETAAAPPMPLNPPSMPESYMPRGPAFRPVFANVDESYGRPQTRDPTNHFSPRATVNFHGLTPRSTSMMQSPFPNFAARPQHQPTAFHPVQQRVSTLMPGFPPQHPSASLFMPPHRAPVAGMVGFQTFGVGPAAMARFSNDFPHLMSPASMYGGLAPDGTTARMSIASLVDATERGQLYRGTHPSM